MVTEGLEEEEEEEEVDEVDEVVREVGETGEVEDAESKSRRGIDVEGDITEEAGVVGAEQEDGERREGEEVKAGEGEER